MASFRLFFPKIICMFMFAMRIIGDVILMLVALWCWLSLLSLTQVDEYQCCHCYACAVDENTVFIILAASNVIWFRLMVSDCLSAVWSKMTTIVIITYLHFLDRGERETYIHACAYSCFDENISISNVSTLQTMLAQVGHCSAVYTIISSSWAMLTILDHHINHY